MLKWIYKKMDYTFTHSKPAWLMFSAGCALPFIILVAVIVDLLEGTPIDFFAVSLLLFISVFLIAFSLAEAHNSEVEMKRMTIPCRTCKGKGYVELEAVADSNYVWRR